jgi:hypothetical protein
MANVLFVDGMGEVYDREIIENLNEAGHSVNLATQIPNAIYMMQCRRYSALFVEPIMSLPTIDELKGLRGFIEDAVLEQWSSPEYRRPEATAHFQAGLLAVRAAKKINLQTRLFGYTSLVQNTTVGQEVLGLMNQLGIEKVFDKSHTKPTDLLDLLRSLE